MTTIYDRYLPLEAGVDFTLSGDTLTFLSDRPALAGDQFRLFYSYADAGDADGHFHAREAFTGANVTSNVYRLSRQADWQDTLLLAKLDALWLWVHYASNQAGTTGEFVRLAMMDDRNPAALVLNWWTAPVALPAGEYVQDMKSVDHNTLYLLTRVGGRTHVLKYEVLANTTTTLFDGAINGWQLFVVSDTELYFVEKGGGLYSSIDGGATWQNNPAPAPAWALTVSGGAVYVEHEQVDTGAGDINDDTRYYTVAFSTNRGVTWNPRQGTSHRFSFGGTGFVQTPPGGNYIGYGGAAFLFSEFGMAAPGVSRGGWPNFQDSVAQFVYFSNAFASVIAIGTQGIVVNAGGSTLTQLPHYPTLFNGTTLVATADQHRFSVVAPQDYLAVPAFVAQEFYITTDRAVAWQTFSLPGYGHHVAFVGGYN